MSATNAPFCLFISHSGADIEPARELKRRLLNAPDARAAGLRVWLDKDDLTAGGGWQTQLEKAITEEATAFAVHVGAKGVVNWVESEVRLGLSRATSAPDYPFIPILAKECTGISALPAFARQYHAVRDPLNDPEEFAKLLRAVLRRSSGEKTIVLNSPFVGLKAMTEADADRFFGRSEEISDLVDKLKARPLVAIVADSGAGKSSLAQAGLIPAFRGGALADTAGREPDDRLWHVVVMRPGKDPIAGLKRGVTEAAERLGRSAEQCAALRKRIDPADPSETAYAIRCDLPVGKTETLLVVDQFEELLTETGQSERGPFVDLLMTLAAAGGFRIVLTLRADHFNLCRPLSKLFEHLTLDRFNAVLRLGRITEKGITEAVRNPLRLAGHTDLAEQDAVIALIRRDISDRAGDLALVQMALYAMWQKHRTDGVDLLVAYSQVGGVAGALAHEAEHVRTDRLDDAQRALLAPIFVRLVRLGETSGATRRAADLGDFDGPRRTLAAKLATEDCGRLLLAGEKSVEVAHEALITQWPWLQDTLNVAASDMRILDRLMDRTRRWNTTGARGAGHLGTGAEREEFAALAARRSDWLSEAEHEFVAASNQGHSRAVRWWRVGIAALVAAVVLLAATTFFALYHMNLASEQRQIATSAEKASRLAAEDAKRERDNALLAHSRLLADLANQHTRKGDAGTAMLLALEALPDKDGGSVRPLAHEAEAALFKAYQELRESRVMAHKGPLWSASFSPHGGLVVTASEDRKAYMWDENGTKRVIDEHTEPVHVAAFSPNGERLIVASTDARLWAIGADKRPLLLKLLKHGGLISSVVFSADSRLVVTASDNSARVWDVDTGERKWLLDGHEGLVRVVAFDPAARRVLTGSDDNKARLWDMATGKLVRVLEGHAGPVRGAAFSVDGRRAMTTSEDETARLWDLEANEPPVVLSGHRALVWSVAFSPDGRLVVTASDDGTARVWNADTGEFVRVLEGHEAPVSTAVFSHDGRSIVTASRNGIARVWDAASGDLNAVLNGHLGLAGVASVAFSADDAQVLTASNDGTARLWDVRPQTSRRMLVLDARAPVRSAMFIRDGREVLTVEEDPTVRLWDAENGRILGSSRDGRLILTVLSSDTWAVSDSVTGGRIGVLKLSDGSRPWLRLMTGPNDNAAQLWDPKWGLPPLINRVAFAVSHDGKRIVMGSADEKAVVRSLETGEHVATLSGHEHSIYDVAFSPDGVRIVTAAGDRTARIWDATSGQTVAVLEGHKSDVWSASFSPDGERVVTASHDGTARIWKVFPTTQALVDQAKTVVPRCLRGEQRLAAFLPSTPPAWCVEAKKWPHQTGE